MTSALLRQLIPQMFQARTGMLPITLLQNLFPQVDSNQPSKCSKHLILPLEDRGICCCRKWTRTTKSFSVSKFKAWDVANSTKGQYKRKNPDYIEQSGFQVPYRLTYNLHNNQTALSEGLLLLLLLCI